MKMRRPISFDWDEGNQGKNWLKHKVGLKEGEQIFFNRPLKIFDDKKHSLVETRYVAYGTTDENRRLTAVFTLRQNKIRVISARDQNKKERSVYE